MLVIGGMMVIAGLGISIRENLEPEEKVIMEKGDSQVDKEVVFDISGEVMKPGVYKLKMGSRINDALIIAGGLGVNADREWVGLNLNKAEIIRDGQKIVIPMTREGEENITLGKASGLVSLNNAGVEDLDGLPGIGPGLAGELLIIGIRQGGFKNIEELKLVSGIGDKLYEGIKDLVGL